MTRVTPRTLQSGPVNQQPPSPAECCLSILQFREASPGPAPSAPITRGSCPDHSRSRKVRHSAGTTGSFSHATSGRLQIHPQTAQIRARTARVWRLPYSAEGMCLASQRWTAELTVNFLRQVSKFWKPARVVEERDPRTSHWKPWFVSLRTIHYQFPRSTTDPTTPKSVHGSGVFPYRSPYCSTQTVLTYPFRATASEHSHRRSQRS